MMNDNDNMIEEKQYKQLAKKIDGMGDLEDFR